MLSDVTVWVGAGGSDPEIAPKLATLPKGQDILTPPNTVILDAWGTPIRYITASNYQTTNGVFMSAGPDGKFSMSKDANAKNWPKDEIYNTDPN